MEESTQEAWQHMLDIHHYEDDGGRIDFYKTSGEEIENERALALSNVDPIRDQGASQTRCEIHSESENEGGRVESAGGGEPLQGSPTKGEDTDECSSKTEPSEDHFWISLPPREYRPYQLLPLWLLAGLGGVIVGYATTFLGAVFAMPAFLEKISPSLYRKKKFAPGTNYCSFSDASFLVLSSIVLPCAAIGLFLAYALMKWKGRRPQLFVGSIVELVGLAFIIWFPSDSAAIFGFTCIGFGVGIHCLVIPTLCSELVPKNLAKKFGILFGYQVVGGAVASLVLLGASFEVVWGWRVPFGVLGSLVILLMLVSRWIEESPRFYLETNEERRGLEVLVKMRPNILVADIRMEWETLLRDVQESRNISQVAVLLSQPTRPTLTIMLASVLLPQLVTSAPMLFFGPLVLGSLFKVNNQQYYVAAVAGVLGVICTLAFSSLVPINKRRCAYVISFILVAVSQFVLWIVFFFFTYPLTNMKKEPAYTAATMIVVTYVAVAVLLNPHGWTHTSLGRGSTLGLVWIFGLGFLVSFAKNICSIILLCQMSSWIFFVDAGIAAVCVVIIRAFVMDTAEDIGDDAVSNWSQHWFWKRFSKEEEGQGT